MNPKISVVLTAWNRPQYLEEQVAAIMDQTISPVEIVLWYNKPSKRLGLFNREVNTSFKNADKVRKICCDHNFGIFPRFAISACLEGEYISIFDDDTIPGRRWFENCMEYVDTERCLLGTIGLRYLSLEKGRVTTEKPRMGWEGQNETIAFVDLVGHTWFYRKEWIRFMWEEMPLSMSFGEDIHFCSLLGRNGIRAACPPHPPHDKTQWGSIHPERGIDRVAISAQDHSADYHRVVCEEIRRGYLPLKGDIAISGL